VWKGVPGCNHSLLPFQRMKCLRPAACHSGVVLGGRRQVWQAVGCGVVGEVRVWHGEEGASERQEAAQPGMCAGMQRLEPPTAPVTSARRRASRPTGGARKCAKSGRWVLC